MFKIRSTPTIVRPPAPRSALWLAFAALLGVVMVCVAVSRPTAVIAQVNPQWGAQGDEGHVLMSRHLATALAQHHRAGRAVEALEIGQMLQQHYPDTPSGAKAMALLPGLERNAGQARAQAVWHYEKVDGEGFGSVVVTQARSQGDPAKAWIFLLRKTAIPRLDGVFLVLPASLAPPCSQACVVSAQFSDSKTSFRLEPVEGHPGQWEFLDKAGLVSRLRSASKVSLSFEGGASAQFDASGWSPTRSGWPNP